MAKKQGQEADTTKKGASAEMGEDAHDKDSASEHGRKGEGRKAADDKEHKKESSKEESRSLIESIGDARQFLREVWIEFNKITWPGRQQIIQETCSVLFLVTAITLMVLAFDWCVGHGVFGPLEHWARLHGGGIGKG